jgi:WD40 repeat protein
VSWALAIDFGTTNTAAAFAVDGGTPTVLEVEGTRSLPSVVVADGAGNLLTGKAAARQALAYPERAERVPKRALVTGGTVVLGGRPFQAAELAAAVLRKVFDEAVRYHGGVPPETVILTHPVRWGEQPLDRLRAAAAQAGITDVAKVIVLSEPEGAAWFYAPPRPGEVVAVFDLGGGTLDTAVLRASDDGFTLAGQPGGDAELGGEDFDEALLAWVGARAAERDPEAWAEIEGDGPRAARDRALLRADVITAKEALSDDLKYEVPVPGFDEGIMVRRADLEEVIGDLVDRAAAEGRRTIDTARMDSTGLTAVYLTGGSSRVQLVSQRLASALGLLPRLEGDLKAVVVLGALKAHATPPVVRPPAPIVDNDSVPEATQPDAAGPAATRPRVQRAVEVELSQARVLKGIAGAAKTATAEFAEVAWSTDGVFLAACTGQCLDIWNVAAGHRVLEDAWSGWSALSTFAWSTDRSRFAYGQLNQRRVKISTPALLTKRMVERGIEIPGVTRVRSLAWNRSGQLIAVGAAQGDVCVVKSGTGKPAFLTFMHGDGRGFFPGGALPAAAGAGQELDSWAPPLAWCPRQDADGELLAFGAKDGVIRGLVPPPADAKAIGGKPRALRELLRLPDVPVSLAWSPDGSELAVCTLRSFLIWRRETGETRELAMASPVAGCRSWVQWTGDGRYLVAFHRDPRLSEMAQVVGVTLWDAVGGSEIRAWRASAGSSSAGKTGPAAFDRCRGIALSPSGASLAIVWAKRPPEIWELDGL